MISFFNDPRWAGIGIGNSMKGADIYVGWKNSTGGTTLSRRSSPSTTMPIYSSSQISSPIPLQVAAPSWAKIAFSFSRPIAQVPVIKSDSNFIFAYSDSIPINADDPRSSFSIHSNEGILPVVDFLAAGSGVVVSGTGRSPFVSSSAEQYKTVLIAHGILFFFAWAVAPFIGIFVARYLKKVLGVWWYRLHLGLMLGVTGLLSIISFVLIILYKKPPHFDSSHTILGLIVVISTIIQISLGFISNELWYPERKSIPWWDKLHWWVGRILFVLAIVNVYLGILQYEDRGYVSSVTGISIAYWIFIAAGLAVLLFGQYKYGQVHATSEQNSENIGN